MKKYFIIFFVLLSATCFSQINVVPMPAEVTMGKGKFNLNSKTTIILGHSPIREEIYANYLNKMLKEKYGFKLKIIRTRNQGIKNNFLELSFTPFEVKPADSYTLNVTAKSISLVSYYDKGLFNGIQTLLQLIENNKLPNTKQQTPNIHPRAEKQIFEYMAANRQVLV